MSVNAYAKMQLMIKWPGIEFNGLRKKLKQIIIQEEEEDSDVESLDQLWDTTYIPDGYKICNFCKVLTIFEIEDTSMLSEAKLDEYAEIAWAFDSDEEWHIQFCITDRYGMNERFLKNYVLLLYGNKDLVLPNNLDVGIDSLRMCNAVGVP